MYIILWYTSLSWEGCKTRPAKGEKYMTDSEQPAQVQDNAPSLTDIFGPVIFAVTRKDLLENGDLVALPDEMVQQAGLPSFNIRNNVAISRAAYVRCVQWTEEDNKKQDTYQDESGRMWDVLWMLYCHLVSHRATVGQSSEVMFPFYVVERDGVSQEATLTHLKAVLGSDEQGARCLTILEPHED